MKEEIKIEISCINPECKKKWFKVISVMKSDKGAKNLIETCSECKCENKIELANGYVLDPQSNFKRDIYRGN